VTKAGAAVTVNHQREADGGTPSFPPFLRHPRSLFSGGRSHGRQHTTPSRRIPTVTTAVPSPSPPAVR